MKSNTKKTVLTCFLCISVINEFSLARILDLGITDGIEQEVISLGSKFPVPLPTLDDGKLVTIDPNLQANTLEETKEQVPELVVFYLYTQKNPDDPQKLYLNDTKALKKSNFDPQKPTILFVHGWITSYRTSPAVSVRKAYIHRYDYNVLIMDWSSIAINPYPYVAECVMIVSEYFANKISFLVDQGANATQLHVSGHSLGAHIAGLGSRFSNHQVPYIIGMDPAYPRFENAKPGERISDTDVDYVLIIHASNGHLGYPSPIESIISKKGFWSWQCDSYDDFESGKCSSNPAVLMGTDEPRTNVTGLYYLNTAPAFPFALGRDRK